MALPRPFTRLLGPLFFAVSVGFLVVFALDHLETMPPLDWRSPVVLGRLAAAAALTMFGLVAMAHCWRVLLRGFGEPVAGAIPEMIDLSTQAAKYVPGNVAHFVGRIALAKGRGYSVTRSTAAMVLEHVLAGYVGVLLVLFGLAFTPAVHDPLDAYLPARPLLLAVSGAGAVLPFVAGPVMRAIGRRLPRRVRELGTQLEQLRKRDIAAATVLIVLFYGSGGLALSYTAEAVMGQGLAVLPAVTLFAAGWVAGTATPGAPGGLGVREAVLSLGLTPMIGAGPALSVALVARMASIAADAAVSTIGSLWLKRSARRGAGGGPAR